MSISFQGTMTALVTPFDGKGEVDFDAMKNLINFQIKNKVDAIVVCGSTGESATLSAKEKQAIIIRAVEYAKGRVPIIAGTGTNETHEALDQTLMAKEHGADAALLVAPYYNKPTQEGLFEHFRLISENVDIPQIIYNVPSRTGINITAETQLKIANKCKNVVATKEASGDLVQAMRIIKDAPEGFAVLSGDDTLTLPLISIGVKGVISVISNFAPKEFGQCVKLALKGDFEKAQKAQYKLLELLDLCSIETNPIPVKSALAMMGYIEEVYRLPLLPITRKSKTKLKNGLINAGILKGK